MKLIHQRIIDERRGDCIQCCLCSLLDLNYEDIPDLFSSGVMGFWYSVERALEDNGYWIRTELYNPIIDDLYKPTDYCFNPRPKFDDEYSLDRLSEYEGVNRLYIGIVLSPKYFKWYDDLWSATHAVIVNEDCSIVHDPNPNYMDLNEYPLARVLGYNGVTKVYVIEKKV